MSLRFERSHINGQFGSALLSNSILIIQSRRSNLEAMAEINAICIVHTLTGTHTFVKESFAAKAGTASRHVQDLKLRYPMYTYMGRPTYVCATCSENFTRKYVLQDIILLSITAEERSFD
jgi:hypothetical protein